MKCVADIYYDTKFDSANIPDSPELITNQFHNSFNSVYVKQDRELVTIKIEAVWGQVKNADYCVIVPESGSKQFYFIIAITMINDNVAELSLLEDVITSVGGVKALTFIDGWCTRLSVGDDSIFKNVLPESFTPANPLQNKVIGHIGPVYADVNESQILCATCDILDSSTEAETYTSSGGEVTVPKMPAIAVGTDYLINEENSDTTVIKNNVAGMNSYPFDNADVKEGVRRARSLGIESTISACYSVPNFYIADKTIEANTIKSMVSKFKKTVDIDVKNLFGYEAENNKVYANNCMIYIKSVGSQNSISYQPWEIQKNGYISFVTFADLAPNGRPYCRPTTFYGIDYNASPDNILDTGISGYSWQNIPITFTDVTDRQYLESNINLKGAEIQNSISASNLAISSWNNRMSAFNDLTGMVSGAGRGIAGSMSVGKLGAGYGSASQYRSGFGQAASGMLDFTNSLSSYVTRDEQSANIIRQASLADLSLSRERMQYEYDTNIIVPQTSFPQSVSIASYVGNGFLLYITLMSAEDLKRYDNYLTRFGYTVSEELTKEKLFTRTNFNFVQANSVFVDDSNEEVTNRRAKAINAIFSSGLRIWHVNPSRANLLTNPIKEATA